MLGLLVLAIAVGANAVGTPWIPDLARPVRIVNADYYLDGGTVGTTLAGTRGDTLSGGFDGRMQEGGSAYPRHCYLGGSYVRNPGVRILPLWGKQERAFVSLVQQGIDSGMSRDRKRLLLATTTAVHLSVEEVGIWHLVRATEARRRLLDALDRGEIMGDGTTLSWFEAKGPLTLDRITHDKATDAFEIVVVDRASGGHTIYLPADSARVTSEPTRLGGKFNLSMPVGTIEDRLLMQLLFIALRDDRSPSSASLRGQVRDLLQTRRQQILAEDGMTRRK